MKPRLRSPKRNRRAKGRQRRGSTLMIVVVLLGLLLILGVLFFTFAAQERSNAEYFANGAKNTEDPGLNADILFDFGLEQLIIGTDPSYKNSALWGTRHSMAANALGVDKNQRVTDITAFNGQGVHVVRTTSGEIYATRDLSSAADRTNVNLQNYLLGINDSPAANNLSDSHSNNKPQPDVGYTYPDINTPFLAYFGWTRDRNTGNVRQVIIPSFHRPQLLRDNSGSPIPLWEDLNYDGTFNSGDLDNYNTGNLDRGVPYDGNGNETPNRLFRPHPSHLFVPPGQQSNTNVSRFISTAADAQALLGDGKRVFPFLPMYPGYNPSGSGSAVTLNNPPTWVGHQGVWSGPHPTDTTRNDDSQLDVDNDGDGIRDGVWLDLDFQLQELPDGTLFIPLFSFTVYDLDALFNLNAHGNIQHLLFANSAAGPTPFNNNSNPFGTNPNTGLPDFISASNHGVMPGEVNFAWGLTGRPGLESSGTLSSVFAQYSAFFGQLPVDASGLSTTVQQQRQAWFEAANMDMAYLKMGRPQINSGSGGIDKLHAGLYGEEHLINQYFSAGANDALRFPHAGQSLADDNQDQSEAMLYNPRQIGSTWLDVDQPQDWAGIGSITDSANVKRVDRLPTTGRLRWTRFNAATSNGRILWGNASVQGGALLQNSQQYGLYDDPSEVALYATDRRDVDDPFTAEDAAYLAMDNNDLLNLGITSRLSDLASFNFSTSSTTNSRGETIRKRFTTVGNDRKNYGLPRSTKSTGGRTWEWNDDQGNLTATTSPLRFPPVFGTTPGSIPQNLQRYGSLDPFRQEVRYLLSGSTDDPAAKKQFQQKLSINKLLTLQNRQLVYRDLVPHADDPGATPIPNQSYPYPPSDAISQEYFARRDRQQLARDIYVLLYLLGSGQDVAAAATTSVAGTTVYTDQQLEQMARFAVNLVDAQDRDNVMTRFEYDRDLSNGWNLDDNPYTIDSGTTDRAEVWGVERQELTFSEVLAFKAAQYAASNSGFTAHNEQVSDRQFVCIELRNVAPYEIKFTDKDTWQVVMKQVEPGDTTPTVYNPAVHPLKERRLTLRNQAGRVLPGEFYTIFSTDQNEPSANPSAFRVDLAGGSSPTTWVVPSDSTFSTPANTNSSHIDLVAEAASGAAFLLTDGASPPNVKSTAGDFLTDTAPGTFVLDETMGVRWALRRRAHPTRSRPSSAAEEADNPWVEVDRIEQEGNMPVFNPNGMASMVSGQLATLVSRERAEPLVRVTQPFNPPGDISNSFRSSTAGENSRSTTTQFQISQVHPDRPFGSLGEIMAVPVVGPPPYDNNETDADPNPWDSGTSQRRDDGLTTYMREIWAAPANQYGAPGAFPNVFLLNWPKSAAAAFMLSDYPDSVSTNAQFDNNWHRVLEVLEVPTRMHKNLNMGSEFNIPRVPGRINLNTLRYPEVLAGLVDDQRIVEMNLSADPRYPTLSDAASGEALRDWFQQLQNSRDPQDLYWANNLPPAQRQDLRLPGTPAVDTLGAAKARPFRSLGYMDDGKYSAEHTVLRTLPIDSGSPTKRHLFELGTNAENAAGTIDPELRHQILTKMWGNTTVRSNSFVAFISVKFFRAGIDPATGATRIGGPLREFQSGIDENPELPEYRGAFIIDRSNLENGTASFRPYVLHRRTLVEP